MGTNGGIVLVLECPGEPGFSVNIFFPAVAVAFGAFGAFDIFD